MSPPVPWNKNRCVGPRIALTQPQVLLLEKRFQDIRDRHDRCLFMLAVDSMLRCGDLLQLKVGDVMKGGSVIRDQLNWKQQKTQKGVYPVLTAATQEACFDWIKKSGKGSGDYLFTRRKPKHSKPISGSNYRSLIKKWVESLDLDSADYSTHSLRRTKPVFLYQHGVSIEDIAILLGHKDPQSTMHYLGLTIGKAQSEAVYFDIFDPLSSKSHLKANADFQLTDSDIDRIAERFIFALEERLKKRENKEDKKDEI